MSEEPHLAERVIVEELRTIAAEVERVPRTEDIKAHASFPSNHVHQVFGSLASAQLAAGMEPTTVRGLPDELLLNELEAVAAELGRTPTRRAFDERSLLPASGFKSRWGSWTDALKEIGLEPNVEPEPDVTREDVVERIRQVGEELGRNPTIDEVIEHSEATRWQLTVRFGKFSVMAEEAGFESTLTPVRNRD
ncbi:homing endonuclease associated repeat-containing protein [Halomarina oriensis]|uniref:Uncharacterized protein n=1 Tax=Halomarina oriensis TaxID=671145 RepID=A0A6B0GRA4_9EURY|nr:hypothetical protein [Halomarina oriensis]MWG35907.1 hypothetical protein [Halomarina oriensis]